MNSDFVLSLVMNFKLPVKMEIEKLGTCVREAFFGISHRCWHRS